jgi:hypothetical protein
MYLFETCIKCNWNGVRGRQNNGYVGSYLCSMDDILRISKTACVEYYLLEAMFSLYILEDIFLSTMMS